MPALQCPRCSQTVQVAAGQMPVCPNCGHGRPDTGAAPFYAGAPSSSFGTGQPPQYAATYPGMAPPNAYYGAQKTDGMAVAALVLGCLGWMSILGVVASILAVIFGFVSQSRIAANPMLKGKGMATAGIVLGFAWLALWLLFLLFFAAVFGAMGRAFT